MTQHRNPKTEPPPCNNKFRGGINISYETPAPGFSSPEVVFKTSEDAAEYISGMLIELRGIASSSSLEFLAFLLDMAYEEAVQRSSSGRVDSSS
jgi:hypothetical protein